MNKGESQKRLNYTLILMLIIVASCCVSSCCIIRTKTEDLMKAPAVNIYESTAEETYTTSRPYSDGIEMYTSQKVKHTDFENWYSSESESESSDIVDENFNEPTYSEYTESSVNKSEINSDEASKSSWNENTFKEDQSKVSIDNSTNQVTSESKKPTYVAEDSKDDGFFYVTKTGNKIHKSSCKYLKSSRIKVDARDAIKKGYTPCRFCCEYIFETSGK